ncbi:MAG TPA: hypothetical protein DCF33_19010 [Saprospirales bacterium]|nr:hypothetical protein [Saprospirales bacterium]
MEPNEPVTDNRPEWLKALTEKSWNLELIISGAAIFLANYLPDGVDSLLKYYLQNWVMDEDFTKITLPLLAFSFMKVVAWTLIITFVVHFVMRAFWAGVVGLHAVYPDGIRYDNLPWVTDFTREQSRERFGTLADYILQLDRLANQVFSVAFLIALTSLGIALAYLLVFALINVIPVYAGKEAGGWISTMVLILFVGMAMTPVLMQSLMKSPKWSAKPWVQKMAKWAIQNAGFILMPFIYRPLTYLNLTFNSQIPKKRLVTALILGFTLFMGAVVVTFATTMLHLAGRNTFLNRHYFAQGRNEYTLTGGVYDNLRDPSDRLPPVSIPAEIVESPFLRVFLDYPKLLDGAIARHCQSPSWPDSLSKSVRRLKTDSTNLACLESIIKLKVNDSLIVHPEWMFHEHPIAGSPGLVTYVPSKIFKHGKNKLLVQVPSTQKPDSLRVYGELFFWYEPE